MAVKVLIPTSEHTNIHRPKIRFHTEEEFADCIVYISTVDTTSKGPLSNYHFNYCLT